MRTLKDGPWKVYERTLSDNSKAYDVWFEARDGLRVQEVTHHCITEGAAYRLQDALNEAWHNQ